MENILKDVTENLIPIQHDIVECMLKGEAKTRDMFVKELNKPRTTIFDNLKKLEKKRIVWRFLVPNGKRGRSLVYWQIKQAHDLILFNTKKVEKNNKKFKLVKEINLIGLKEKYDKPIIVKKERKKPTKILDKTSYILNNQNSKLTKFILDDINKCTYFRTTTLSKRYINISLKIKNIEGTLKRSVSNKVGRIISELNNLNIIIAFSKSTWKNLHKDQLYSVLEEKMEQNYHIIKLKKVEK